MLSSGLSTGSASAVSQRLGWWCFSELFSFYRFAVSSGETLFRLARNNYMRFLPFVKSFLNLVSRSFPCYPLRFLSTTAIQHYTCYTPPVKGATMTNKLALSNRGILKYWCP